MAPPTPLNLPGCPPCRGTPNRMNIPPSPRSPPSARLSSPGFSVFGDSYHIRLERSVHDEMPRMATRIQQLEAELEQLQQANAAANAALSEAKRDIAVLENALELERCMTVKGPLRITPEVVTGGAVGQAEGVNLWRFLSFSALKKEHARRMEVIDSRDSDMQKQREHYEAIIQSIRNDHARERQELEDRISVETRTSESLRRILDHLQLGEVMPLLNEEGQGDVVRRCMEAALEEAAIESSLAEDSNFDFSKWSTEDLLEPLGLHRILAEAVHGILTGPTVPKQLQTGYGKRALLHQLARYGTRETMTSLLRTAPLLQSLTDTIWNSISSFGAELDLIAKNTTKVSTHSTSANRKFKLADVVRAQSNKPTAFVQVLRNAKAASEGKPILLGNPQLHGQSHKTPMAAEVDWSNPDSWSAMDARELTYGETHLFFGSLQEFTGTPSTDGLPAMAREHTLAADSDVEFTAPNYDIKTTSKAEWYIVADPPVALEVLGLDDWTAGGAHTPTELGFRLVAAPDSAQFAEKMKEINGRLASVGDMACMTLEHFCALRMYTGPLYCKYNTILRGARKELSNQYIQDYIDRVCKGNMYPTTLHHMCLGIDKLSKLTAATKVYRAPGGRLPSSFLTPNMYGSRGGVELGFMSTTTAKEEAKKYAAYSGAPVIFEIQQGMTSRGADISWLSQFPSEQEVLFAPLTAIEVYRFRSDGAFVVVELRPNSSFASQRSSLELEAYARQSDVLQLMLSESGRSALVAKLGAEVKLHSTDQRKLRNIADITRAAHLKSRLVAEAAALSAAEAEKEIERLTAVAEASGWTVELKSMFNIAQSRLARARLDMANLALADMKKEMELDAAVKLDGMRTWARVREKVVHQKLGRDPDHDPRPNGAEEAQA